jgi:hypothetical protein
LKGYLRRLAEGVHTYKSFWHWCIDYNTLYESSSIFFVLR